jgi:hypothetical protein
VIQLACERVVSLGRASRHFPRRRGGKRPHVATLYRWAQSGVQADDGEIVVLETIRVGRTRCTSIEAIQRFCERVSSAGTSYLKGRPRVVQSQVDAAIEQAAQERGL